MRMLFLHPNMPGQFKHLARAFADEAQHTIVFVTKPRPHIHIPGVTKLEYTPPREANPLTHPYLITTERAIRQGQEVYRLCKAYTARSGFTPDIIIAHPGWGDALFIRDLYPQARMLSFFEFYYGTSGADVNFDPNDPLDEDGYGRIQIKNTTNLLSLAQADWGYSPTHWQWQQHPAAFRPSISVLHDGIDTTLCRPHTGRSVTLPNGTRLREGDQVVTYIARNFEPYRGFPSFMQAAEMILKEHPNAHIVAIGSDGVSYGKPPPGGKSYRQIWQEKLSLDSSRIHFVGHLKHEHMLHMLQLSSAHIYLTYPFVLSWSFLEAMACGCALVASRTTPVEEVMTDGMNGLLVDFFNPRDIADAVSRLLTSKDRMQPMRDAARQTVLQHYALQDVLPLHMQLVRDIAEGRTPPPAAAAIAAHYPPPATPLSSSHRSSS